MKPVHARFCLSPWFPAILAACAAFSPACADSVPVSMLHTLPGLEVSVWATSPMLKNPTNIDIDQDGRIWVAEGVNYRGHYERQPEGDRIVVLQDTDGDGKADDSWVFVQEPFLRAPMGVAVLDNKIVVSMTPDLIIYTDVDRDLRFSPGTDTREVLLTGFNGRKHDHSLHSVTAGPDGRWYWNAGNCGAVVTDKSGRTFRVGSAYDPYYGRDKAGDLGWNPREIAGQKSDDGHVYIGGFAARMNPDGTGMQIIGHNFRNSYEQTVTSFGDVFQNDNDDPPASRTAFLLEYGNAGFCSFDGQRAWQADRRPGQSTPVAEWRQEDPGTMPAGDVYGGGSPTGIAFYENGALGPGHGGMLLSCEPARNTVFGYKPKPEGAGFKLERFDFLTSNQEGEFAGADFKGGESSINRETKTLFRPSDVAVGPDGAVYVADWYDPRVGGHSDRDDSLSGTIYRVAPAGFKPRVPKFNLNHTQGQLAALRSPAVQVRNLGFTRLRQQGESALPALSKLLEAKNPYFQARAIWLAAQLGPPGLAKVEPILEHEQARFRIVAYRALRQQNHRLLEVSKKMARDPSPAVRREVALAMRDIPFAQSGSILQTIGQRYDGHDRTYLEAFGTGCTGKEAEVYEALAKSIGHEDARQWSDAFAGLAWRLHPPAATAGLRQRALAKTLPDDARRSALTALAYQGTRPAIDAILETAAQAQGRVQTEAVWWLLNRKDTVWKAYALDAALKERGIYDPDNIELVEIKTPPAPASQLQPIEKILERSGDAARGRNVAAACQVCHRIDGEGVDLGPELTGWANRQTSDVVLRSIIDPSADIAHGFAGYEIQTKDGLTIDGLIYTDGDPVVIASQGGLVQTIPRSRIAAQKGLGRSLMLSAEQLGLNEQDLADLLAYLKSH